MKGTLPASAMPAATVAIFCSATPISIKRSGNFFSNTSARVDSLRSAQRTTTRSSIVPASTRPAPKPSRVAIFSTSSANTFADSFVWGLIMLKLCKKARSFLFRGRLAVPTVIALYLGHALAGDGVRNNQRGFLDNGPSLFYCRDKGAHIVPPHFKHMPAKGALLIRERLKRHHVLGHSINLDIVAVHYSREVVKFVLTREHRGLPGIHLLLFAITHEAIHTRSNVGRRTSNI